MFYGSSLLDIVSCTFANALVLKLFPSRSRNYVVCSLIAVLILASVRFQEALINPVDLVFSLEQTSTSSRLTLLPLLESCSEQLRFTYTSGGLCVLLSTIQRYIKLTIKS